MNVRPFAAGYQILQAWIALRHLQENLQMFKVMALIVGGIFLMSMGVYALSVSGIQFPALVWPEIQWPEVNWALVGFVVIVGGIISAGTGVVMSRLT